MNEIATYTFLPWLRQGIVNQITGQSGNRATIPVELVVHGEKVGGGSEDRPAIKKDVQIYGPGEITGFDRKAIVKVEPQNMITNFEPNYLPYIEFYEEDFPWRYSPMPNPNDHRLIPWLALIVLKDTEFKDGKNIKDKPLPYINLSDKAKLPPAEQLWAWAHVHVNRNLIDNNFISTEATNISQKLESILKENPDLAYSRIVCPRKLEAEQAYHAFLVPVFERGLLAGLGQDPSGASGPLSYAWDATAITDGYQLPYYYRWYFRTGTIGDFEYLVRLLEPKPVDNRVGIRDMGVQDPGANIQGIIDDPGATDEQKLYGILKLGGALRIPDIFYSPEEFKKVKKYRNWATLNNTQSYPHPFQKDLASFINLTDSYEEKDAAQANSEANISELQTASDDSEYDIGNNPDPLITAPLYGRWHALQNRLLKERNTTTNISPNDNWIHELNLDPRWRVPAGFGTKVIQENQENYMKAAWDQIGEVLEANKKIKEAQLANAVSSVWYDKHLNTMKQKYKGKWLSVASPVHNRVISEGFTVSYQKNESKLTSAITSVNMRKMVRSRGKVVQRLPKEPSNTLISRIFRAFGSEIGIPTSFSVDQLISRMNKGEITAAPPKITPEGIQKPKDVADKGKPTNVPKFLIQLLERYPWIKWILLILAITIIILLLIVKPSARWMSIGTTAVAVLGLLYYLFIKWIKQISKANDILEENQTPESIDKLPSSPNFRISDPSENFTPTTGIGEDSEEAKRFKLALKDVNILLQESVKLGKVKERPSLKINQINETVFQSINPTLTIPRWIFDAVKLPPHVVLQLKEEFVEAMAYPKFDLPMYKPLTDYSAELFLPNINYVEQNSISILETNQKFIESYMVGLNHEFARELLWREYPTDQRGSYFRQFWGVSSFLDTQPIEIEALKARYKKILDERIEPELQEYYDQLLDTSVEKDEAFLNEAHQLILKEELKDIKPLHIWSKYWNLGDHDNREQPGDNEEEVVLVIRGELLKKYPTAVIYAHKAEWTYKKDEDGNYILDDHGEKIIDLTKERTLAEIPAGQENNPPTTLIKSPLYEAKVDPDIYFFGFDLTACKAKGGTGKEDDPVDERCADKVNWDDAGWFFVIKERPGEPRFGLDIGEGGNIENGKIELWNDLSWGDLTPQVVDGGFIQITSQTPTITANQNLEGDDEEKIPQQTEDVNITWNKDMNAAELAYILYQVPVLVAVHATEMLPNPS